MFSLLEFLERGSAHSVAEKVLSSCHVSLKDIQRLKRALNDGKVEGMWNTSCFIGILAGSSPCGYFELRGKIFPEQKVLRGSYPIDKYCVSVRKGDHPKNNIRCRFMLQWTQEEITKRKEKRELILQRSEKKQPRGTSVIFS